MALGNQANIKAVITADDRASKTLQGFGNKIDSIGGKIAKTMKVVAAATAVAIGAGIVKNVDNAIKRLDTLNNSARTFENMGFAAKDVGKAMSALDKSIRGLPTPLDDAVRGMTLIAAATNDIGKSQQVYTALNNAVLGFGGSAEQASNAVIQLSQDLAGGRITGQTWLSMLNSGLGPALGAMARQMGITTRELKDGLSDGTISVERFQDSLIELNKKGGGGMKSLEQIAKDSTKGIQSAWANMNTAIARGIANLLNAVGRDKIAGFIIGIGESFEKVFKSLVNLGPKLTNIARIAGEVLGPKLKALWNNINEELIPAFKDLWKNVIEPLIPIIGGALVLAIGLAIDALNITIEALGFFHQAIKNGNPIIWGLIGLFGTLSVAMAMTSGFRAITAGFAVLTNITIPATKLKLIGLRALIASPIGFGAIAIGAALFALAKVKQAADEARNAINNADSAARNAADSQGAAIGRLRDLVRNGTPAQQRRARDVLSRMSAGGLQSGTSFSPGGLHLVGERGPEMVQLPRGSQVTPANETQKMMGSQTINLNVNVGMYAGTEIEKRKIAKELMRAFNDAKAMGIA